MQKDAEINATAQTANLGEDQTEDKRISDLKQHEQRKMKMTVLEMMQGKEYGAEQHRMQSEFLKSSVYPSSKNELFNDRNPEKEEDWILDILEIFCKPQENKDKQAAKNQTSIKHYAQPIAHQ